MRFLATLKWFAVAFEFRGLRLLQAIFDRCAAGFRIVHVDNREVRGPQHINLDFPNIDYDTIFYLENLSAISKFFAKLSPKISLETSAPHSRAAGSKLRQHYSDRAIELVQNIYEQDFLSFGYSRDLDDSCVSPGECIVGRCIVAEGEYNLDGVPSHPARSAPCKAFQATMRYHRLIDLLMI